jgi:hypothetical protein
MTPWLDRIRKIRNSPDRQRRVNPLLPILPLISRWMHSLNTMEGQRIHTLTLLKAKLLKTRSGYFEGQNEPAAIAYNARQLRFGAPRAPIEGAPMVRVIRHPDRRSLRSLTQNLSFS